MMTDKKMLIDVSFCYEALFIPVNARTKTRREWFKETIPFEVPMIEESEAPVSMSTYEHDITDVLYRKIDDDERLNNSDDLRKFIDKKNEGRKKYDIRNHKGRWLRKGSPIIEDQRRNIIKGPHAENENELSDLERNMNIYKEYAFFAPVDGRGYYNMDVEAFLSPTDLEVAKKVFWSKREEKLALLKRRMENGIIIGDVFYNTTKIRGVGIERVGRDFGEAYLLNCIEISDEAIQKAVDGLIFPMQDIDKALSKLREMNKGTLFSGLSDEEICSYAFDMKDMNKCRAKFNKEFIVDDTMKWISNDVFSNIFTKTELGKVPRDVAITIFDIIAMTKKNKTDQNACSLEEKSNILYDLYIKLKDGSYVNDATKILMKKLKGALEMQEYYKDLFENENTVEEELGNVTMRM